MAVSSTLPANSLSLELLIHLISSLPDFLLSSLGSRLVFEVDLGDCLSPGSVDRIAQRQAVVDAGSNECYRTIQHGLVVLMYLSVTIMPKKFVKTYDLTRHGDFGH